MPLSAFCVREQTRVWWKIDAPQANGVPPHSKYYILVSSISIVFDNIVEKKVTALRRTGVDLRPTETRKAPGRATRPLPAGPLFSVPEVGGSS